MKYRPGDSRGIRRVSGVVGVGLETCKRVPVHRWILHRWIAHGLIGARIKPGVRPLVHADVNGIEVLPRLNGRREIRMHKLLLLNFLDFLRALTVRVETSSRQGSL